MSDQDGMTKMVEGYRKFREQAYPKRRDLFETLQNQQKPQVLFITCSDSRIDPGLITQTDPGDLFVCRNIGNIVPAEGETAGGVGAVLEYAILAVKVRHIVLCGHSDCGAMKGLKDLDAPGLKAMPAVRRWLRHAEPAVAMAKRGNATGDELTKALIRENVKLQLQRLRQHPAVVSGLAEGTLHLHGWVYDIGKGQIDVLNPAADSWGPLTSR
jgi:carbonic anhydrase